MSPLVQSELKQSPNTFFSKSPIKVGRCERLKAAVSNLFFKCILGKNRRQVYLNLTKAYRMSQHLLL